MSITARSGQDEASVRSQSQDIASELADAEREDQKCTIKIINQTVLDDMNAGKTRKFDSLVDEVEMQSERSKSAHSQRSFNSNTGSEFNNMRKRERKGGLVVVHKTNKMVEDRDADENVFGSQEQSRDKRNETPTDEEAGDIFDQLMQLQSKKGYMAKKTWSDEEYRLLLWAIQKYCKGKNKLPKSLSK